MATTYAPGADNKRRPQPKTPEGYDSIEEFLTEMRERFDMGVSADKHNRDAAVEDLQFTIGKQWDDVVADARRKRRKPVLTVNRIPAFAAQVIGNRLMNSTEIRVVPDTGGTKAVATLREDLMRNIFKNSQADLARDEAQKYQVVCGIGNYCLSVEENTDDVFKYDIRIKAVPDPFAVVYDPLIVEPDAGDARWAFVADDVPEDDFESKYPWAVKASVDDFSSASYGSGVEWHTRDSIKVVSYWRMVTDGTKTLALFKDGITRDVSDVPEEQYLPLLAVRPDDGTPYVREMPKKVARLYVCSGFEILEGPYDLPISSIPVFRVPGWEFRIEEKTHRWGLVRFLKDPQRLHNYWRSAIAEGLTQAPRNKWVGPREAFQGFEKDWRNSHISDDPLLMYNAEGGKPERVPPPMMDQATMTEAGLAVQDMKDVSNMHEASLGIAGNEVSGKAINARQQAADVGTFIYTDRLRMADERCARVMNELIPHVYDTTRLVKLLGSDGKDRLAMINKPGDPNSDVTIGKYGITVTVGPSSLTRRTIAAESMMGFVNAVPQSAPMVMDLIAEAQDWPKSEEFARRFRMMLPPNLLRPDDIPEELQAQMASQQEQQAQDAAIQRERAMKEIERIVAQSNEFNAQAQKALADAQKSLADAVSRRQDVESRSLEREFRFDLDVEKAKADNYNRVADRRSNRGGRTGE